MFRLGSGLNLIRSHVTAFWRRIQPALNPNSIYSRAWPNDQAAVDLFKGEWTANVPGLIGGGRDMFENDARPDWANRAYGGLEGKSVLELGPLEGAHTYKLENIGAKVEAIESNKFAFQRCLIAKNILNMKSKFLVGDFVPFVAQTDKHYDMVFASGVLYHMQNPVATLHDLCRISDSVFLWTHYYDKEALDKIAYNAKSFSSNRTKTFAINGLSVTCHERIYARKWITYFAPGFCGGMHLSTSWMRLEDIHRCLDVFGFEVTKSEADAAHPNGPAVLIFARRKNLKLN